MKISPNYLGILLLISGIVIAAVFPIVTFVRFLKLSNRGMIDVIAMILMFVILLSVRVLLQLLLRSAISIEINLDTKTITAQYFSGRKTFHTVDSIGYYDTLFDTGTVGMQIEFKNGETIQLSEMLIDSVEFIKWWADQNKIPCLGKKVYSIIDIFRK